MARERSTAMVGRRWQSNPSPPIVSAKREYLRIWPKTFGDFSLNFAQIGSRETKTMREKPGFPTHSRVCRKPVRTLHCLAGVGGCAPSDHDRKNDCKHCITRRNTPLCSSPVKQAARATIFEISLTDRQARPARRGGPREPSQKASRPSASIPRVTGSSIEPLAGGSRSRVPPAAALC
jgi:hypothetical protein